MKKIFISLLMMFTLLQISLFSSDLKSEKKIRIDIVSDVVCPWCAIGYKRLSNAIDELKIKDRVEIVWHPFELNPDMPKDGMDDDKYLMNKLGINEEQLKEKRKNYTQLGEQSGFKFDYFADMKKVNTLNAHILLDYAKKYNKQTQLKVRLQEAYFGERKNINNREILYNELKAVGLNADEAIKTLDDENAIKRVRDEEAYWKNQGVFAIPAMIFNGTILKVGANEEEVYKSILTTLL